MNTKLKRHQVFIAIILGFFVSLTSYAESSKSYETEPVIIVRTYDVYGDAEGFLKLIDKAMKTAKKLHPDSKVKTHITVANVAGEYANLITISTTYPNFESYAAAQSVIRSAPKLKAIGKEIHKAGYKAVFTSHNTLVAEY